VCECGKTHLTARCILADQYAKIEGADHEIDIDNFLLFIVIIMEVLAKVFFTAFVFFMASAIVASSED